MVFELVNDTFYPNEYRLQSFLYAQEFNLLNDLNNLTVPTETKKLSGGTKENNRWICEVCMKTLGASNPLNIAKMIDAS